MEKMLFIKIPEVLVVEEYIYFSAVCTWRKFAIELEFLEVWDIE